MIKQKPNFTKNRYFKFFASIRFAIPTLFVFAIAMAYGTICESRFGTEYAKNQVYQTPWFYLIQICIALSVILAVVDRIPFKKKLIGFYTIHAALVTIMIGTVITRYFGIDGSIEINPTELKSSVRLNELMLYVSNGEKQTAIKMPETNSQTQLNQSILLPNNSKGMILEYLPYAKSKQVWKKNKGTWITEWLLKNDRFEQIIQIGNKGVSDQLDLGPLHVEYISQDLFSTYKKILPRKENFYLLQNTKTLQITVLPANGTMQSFVENGTPFTLNLITNKKAGVTFLQLLSKNKKFKDMHFFPKFSPYPLQEHLSVNKSSEYRMYELNLIRSKNAVFLSPDSQGQINLAFGKNSAWTFTKYQDAPINLPWMGFKMALIQKRIDLYPEEAFERGIPNKEEEQNIKAVHVKIEAHGEIEDLWISNRNVVQSNLSQSEWFLGNSEIYLPFKMTLEKFKMDQIPGTNKPASYESFVKILSPDHKNGSQIKELTQHIYMNNPYKADGFTFYQSSYLQDDQGEYHSILSVNKDPGRPVKYAGSLLLVLGLILHFSIIYGYLKVST